jgi:hypothetical protein
MSSGHLGGQDTNGMGGIGNTNDGSGAQGFGKGGVGMVNGCTGSREMSEIDYFRKKFKAKLHEVYATYFKNKSDKNEPMPDIVGYVNTKEAEFYKMHYLQKNNNIEEYQNMCT